MPTKFMRFSLVGGFNTLLTLGIFYILYNVFHTNYLIASVIAYSIGIINSYLWNKFWTFRSTTRAVGFEFSKFAVLNLSGLVLNAIIMALLVEWLGIIPFPAQILTVGIIFTLNFFGSSYWVFRNS